MNKRPIGVWFSFALMICFASAWLGYESGISIARFRKNAEQRTAGSLSAVEWAHLKSVLSALSDMQMRRFGGFHGSEKLKSNLLWEIGQLETLRSKPDIQDIKSVGDLNLAIFYAGVALLEEQSNNTTNAQEYRKLAQGLLRALGWKDYSEETLNDVAQKEMEKWTVEPRGKVTQQ